MTSQVQADRDDFVKYDELEGPDLDPQLWKPVNFPLPTGSEHIAQDPNAEVTPAGGELRVRIPRFSMSSNTFQPVDSAKWVTLSTRRFQIPPDRPVTFAADVAVDNTGGEPSDYRQGMAAFQVSDLEYAFSVIGTSTRVLAMHEHLAESETDRRFIHVVESPYEDFDDDFTQLRACEITFDRGSSTVTWQVDTHQVYHARGAVIPGHMTMGIGIWTQLPIRGNRSQSLRGQGLQARWAWLRVRGATPEPRSSEADNARPRRT